MHPQFWTGLSCWACVAGDSYCFTYTIEDGECVEDNEFFPVSSHPVTVMLSSTLVVLRSAFLTMIVSVQLIDFMFALRCQYDVISFFTQM